MVFAQRNCSSSSLPTSATSFRLSDNGSSCGPSTSNAIIGSSSHSLSTVSTFPCISSNIYGSSAYSNFISSHQDARLPQTASGCAAASPMTYSSSSNSNGSSTNSCVQASCVNPFYIPSLAQPDCIYTDLRMRSSYRQSFNPAIFPSYPMST